MVKKLLILAALAFFSAMMIAYIAYPPENADMDAPPPIETPEAAGNPQG